jgi:tetratricopeptide (TPR) repeat protein
MSDNSNTNSPHPDFLAQKENMWELFLDKNYEDAARASATLLQNSYALDAIHVAGLALSGLNRIDEGYDWLCASLALSSSRPDWYANAAVAMMEKKEFLKAMVFLENGIKDYPQDLRIKYMRGLVMCQSQEWENAEKFFGECLEQDPEFYHAKMSRGFCYHMTGRYAEAIEQYNQIVDVATGADREEIVNNHACVLMELGKQKEALALLDREYPDSEKPGTSYNKSFLWLGMGKWPEAWHLYRHRTVVNAGEDGSPQVDQPKANSLEDIKGKHLFLFNEQGLGDTLMFLRYAEMVLPYVTELTIGVPKSLSRLVKCLDLKGKFNVLAEAEDDQERAKINVVDDTVLDEPTFSRADIAMPMLDCPAMFNTTLETAPNKVPYFTIPQDIIDSYRLPETEKLRVGLVWAGSSRPENIRAHAIDKRRSVPFEMLEPILRLHNKFEFVSLQLPDHFIENEDRMLQPLCTRESDSQDFEGATYRDVLDTAGIVMQLDLVISIDSAMAHLAGALGKPVWMLSRWDGCWRWFWDGRTDTIWYPQMKIYQQKAHHTWGEVVGRVVEDLVNLD